MNLETFSPNLEIPYNRKLECRSIVNGDSFDSQANGNLLLLMTVDNLDSRIRSVYYCAVIRAFFFHVFFYFKL